MKSFVSQDTFTCIQPSPCLQSSSQNCISITGQPLQIEGTAHLTLLIPGNNFLLYSQPLQCVLGWDFLTSNGLQLLYRDRDDAYFLEGAHGSTPIVPHNSLGVLSPNDQCLQTHAEPSNSAVSTMLVQSTNRGPVPVSLQSSTCIPGRSEVIVECQLSKSNKDQLGMISPFNGSDSPSVPSTVLAAYSVCQASSRSVPVRLMNTSNFDIKLHAGQKVGEFCPIVEVPLINHNIYSNVPTHCCSTTTVSKDIIHDLENALSPELSISERSEILATLMKFTDVFQETLGHTDVISHKIDTGDAPPIRQYPRRLPYAFREEVKSQLKSMGLSYCPSQKKDGQYRFCVDYRKLNAVTKKTLTLYQGWTTFWTLLTVLVCLAPWTCDLAIGM